MYIYMANTISYKENSSHHLSNSKTTRLYAILLLHGSSLAKQVYEKKLVLWFAMLDQTIIGQGMATFNILDMPWHSKYLQEQKTFWNIWLSKCLTDHCVNILDIEGDFENNNAIFEDLRMWGMNLTIPELLNKEKETSFTIAQNTIFDNEGFKYSPCHNIIESNYGCYICNNYSNLSIYNNHI